MRNTEVFERPANQYTLTKSYTDEVLSFIRENKEDPFLLYLANSMSHVPFFASEEFQNTSQRGFYGDVVEEIDHVVGRIIALLKEEYLQDNTIVVFTSDNGPWLYFRSSGGSAGLLRVGKGTTWKAV